MSEDKKLKDIIAKRYAEVKKDQKEVLEKLPDAVVEVENDVEPEVIKKQPKKTTSYLPHRIGNKYFLIKIQYFLDMESDFVADSNIEIVGVVPLAQKIIALQYEQTQAKSLKYYYDSQKNKEIK